MKWQYSVLQIPGNKLLKIAFTAVSCICSTFNIQMQYWLKLMFCNGLMHCNCCRPTLIYFKLFINFWSRSFQIEIHVKGSHCSKKKNGKVYEVLITPLGFYELESLFIHCYRRKILQYVTLKYSVRCQKSHTEGLFVKFFCYNYVKVFLINCCIHMINICYAQIVVFPVEYENLWISALSVNILTLVFDNLAVKL